MQTKYTQTKLAATASPYVAHSCPSRKKSKRKRDEAEAKARVKEGVAQYESRYGSGEDEVESGKEVSERDGGGKNDGEEGDGVDDMLTPAQRRFRDKQLARESKKIRSMVEKTHRERVEEFNALLASMTEHNDIPRCSAAGNG